MQTDGKGMGTRLVHAGRDPFAQHGFINTPIYRGSTVLFPTLAALRANKQPYTYGTHGTPTTDALTTAYAELSGAAGCVAVPSGLQAIVLALQSVLRAGDHLLVTDSAYFPTRRFCASVLARFGVETTYYDPLIGAGIEALIRPNTRVVLTEAPGSQSFEMQDIPAIAEAAHKHGALVIMDNTWATPLLFPPHAMGVDIAVEAGTKYLSGHSDLLMGLITANARAWPDVKSTYTNTAPCPGPEDCFLALRGLRTMKLRIEEAGRRALDMAEWLSARPEVKTILHPAFPSCPGHDIWKRDFKGSSGLFSIIVNPVSEKALAALLDGLELFGMGYSWGGYESLIIPFNCASYRTATTWAPGGEGLRLQIGLEDLDDLKADLAAGFARMAAAS